MQEIRLEATMTLVTRMMKYQEPVYGYITVYSPRFRLLYSLSLIDLCIFCSDTSTKAE